MVEEKTLSLQSLPMDSLTGVIHMYPWFGAARKELCRRMSRTGGESWGVGQYAGEALYIADRRSVNDIMRRSRDEDWSDRDVERILKSYIARSDVDTASRPAAAVPVPPVRPATRGPVAGDYFSQEAYDQVARSDDNALRRAVASVREEPEERDQAAPLLGDGFCTETLAGIYAEQGYFGEAKQIYSKLLLAYPEKSVYFASLIEKMDLLLNN